MGSNSGGGHWHRPAVPRGWLDLASSPDSHLLWVQPTRPGVHVVADMNGRGFAVCSRMSRYVAKHLQHGQKAWNTATPRRVAATSSMLGSMKVIKMLGLQNCVANLTRRLPEEELNTASRVRWVMVFYNASGLSQFRFFGQDNQLTSVQQLTLSAYSLPQLPSRSSLLLPRGMAARWTYRRHSRQWPF